jgi:DNA polymerase delta subunit 1
VRTSCQFALRFMIDTKMRGASWVELPAGQYFPRSANSPFPPSSLCTIECDVAFDRIIAHEPEGEWGRLAPLRVS